MKKMKPIKLRIPIPKIGVIVHKPKKGKGSYSRKSINTFYDRDGPISRPFPAI